MAQIKQLHLNLNYAHKNLSSAFRIVSGIIGAILVSIGIASLVSQENIVFIGLLNSLGNVAIGLILAFLSSNFLPGIAKRYFIVDNEKLSYKLTLRKKKTIKWKQIEEIEIDQQQLKIRLETEHKPKYIYLGIISYDDFELLNKVIIDMCMDKDIDLK